MEKLPASHAASPWHTRLRRWLAYALVRAMIGLAGYEQHHGDPRDIDQTPEN